MIQFLLKIFKALIAAFETKKEVISEPVVDLVKEISDYIDQLIYKGTDNPFTKLPYMNFRETFGNNRSEELDKLIIRNGGKLADPYCLYGQQDILRAVELKFKIKFDLPKTGSTQKFFNNTKPEYITNLPLKYSIGIFRQKKDPTRGHAVHVRTQIDTKQFSTFEFNTSPQVNQEIVRDGEGCYFKVRQLVGYNEMELRGFVDIFKAIKK